LAAGFAAFDVVAGAAGRAAFAAFAALGPFAGDRRLALARFGAGFLLALAARAALRGLRAAFARPVRFVDAFAFDFFAISEPLRPSTLLRTP
jgi:hypothetical protein